MRREAGFSAIVSQVEVLYVRSFCPKFFPAHPKHCLCGLSQFDRSLELLKCRTVQFEC